MGDYCIYIHTDPNGKRYIGQTSMNPSLRWGKDGKGYCRRIKGHYTQPLMANAIHKIPWEYWEHEVIYEGLTAEEADLYEEWLIYLAWSNNPKYGYNIESGGNKKKHLSEETKKKISNSHLGDKNPMFGKYGEQHPKYGTHQSEEAKQKNRGAHIGKHSGANHPMAIAVQCIETGEVLYGAKAFQDKYGINRSHICNCCRGKRKTAGGYHWKYYEETLN